MFLCYFSCPDSSDCDSKTSLSETSAVFSSCSLRDTENLGHFGQLWAILVHFGPFLSTSGESGPDSRLTPDRLLVCYTPGQGVIAKMLESVLFGPYLLPERCIRSDIAGSLPSNWSYIWNQRINFSILPDSKSHLARALFNVYFIENWNR